MPFALSAVLCYFVILFAARPGASTPRARTCSTQQHSKLCYKVGCYVQYMAFVIHYKGHYKVCNALQRLLHKVCYQLYSIVHYNYITTFVTNCVTSLVTFELCDDLTDDLCNKLQRSCIVTNVVTKFVMLLCSSQLETKRPGLSQPEAGKPGLAVPCRLAPFDLGMRHALL